MKLRKKKNPVTMNIKKMHANHKPKTGLWYCSHNRQECGGRAGNSLMVRWQGHRRFARPAMSPARLTHCHGPRPESYKCTLISWLVKTECATSLCWKVTSGLLKRLINLRKRCLVPQIKHYGLKRNACEVSKTFPQRLYSVLVCDLSWKAERWIWEGSSEGYLWGF